MYSFALKDSYQSFTAPIDSTISNKKTGIIIINDDGTFKTKTLRADSNIIELSRTEQ